MRLSPIQEFLKFSSLDIEDSLPSTYIRPKVITLKRYSYATTSFKMYNIHRRRQEISSSIVFFVPTDKNKRLIIHFSQSHHLHRDRGSDTFTDNVFQAKFHDSR